MQTATVTAATHCPSRRPRGLEESREKLADGKKPFKGLLDEEDDITVEEKG